MRISAIVLLSTLAACTPAPKPAANVDVDVACFDTCAPIPIGGTCGGCCLGCIASTCKDGICKADSLADTTGSCGPEWDPNKDCCCFAGARFTPTCVGGAWTCPAGAPRYGANHCVAVDEGVCTSPLLSFDVPDGVDAEPLTDCGGPAHMCCCGHGPNSLPICPNGYLQCKDQLGIHFGGIYYGEQCDVGACEFVADAPEP